MKNKEVTVGERGRVDWLDPRMRDLQKVQIMNVAYFLFFQKKGSFGRWGTNRFIGLALYVQPWVKRSFRLSGLLL